MHAHLSFSQLVNMKIL